MGPTVGGIIIVFGIVLAAVALMALLYWAPKLMTDTSTTQRAITDGGLIKLFADQPDGLLSPHRLSDLTDLTLSQARQRLNAFYAIGILKKSHNQKARSFFSLREPYSEPPAVAFSPDPFLTMEDLMKVFRAHDGQITVQEMILATRLPLRVLIREMKHFEKQGIVEQLSTTHGSNGGTMVKFYVLQDPYRSDPTAFEARAGTVNMELKELLTNEQLIV